jgi:hypothetical protein
LSIKFDPSSFLRKVAPESKVKKLVTKGLTLKKSALTFANNSDVLSESAIKKVALKTIKGYKKRSKGDTDLKKELHKDPAQLIQRVQNEVVLQIHDAIKEKYKGEKARWLPSDSEEPRPEHQENYSKTYIIGEGINGIEPGDEYGCRCGVEILVEGSSLDI